MLSAPHLFLTVGPDAPLPAEPVEGGAVNVSHSLGCSRASAGIENSVEPLARSDGARQQRLVARDVLAGEAGRLLHQLGEVQHLQTTELQSELSIERLREIQGVFKANEDGIVGRLTSRFFSIGRSAWARTRMSALVLVRSRTGLQSSTMCRILPSGQFGAIGT